MDKQEATVERGLIDAHACPRRLGGKTIDGVAKGN